MENESEFSKRRKTWNSGQRSSEMSLTGLTLEEYYTTFGAPLQNPEVKSNGYSQLK